MLKTTVLKLTLASAPVHVNECKTDGDCGDSLACVWDDLGYTKCVNPCDGAKCGTNTVCEVVNRKAHCRCLDKHVGNPNQALGCTKVDDQGKKNKVW